MACDCLELAIVFGLPAGIENSRKESQLYPDDDLVEARQRIIGSGRAMHCYAGPAFKQVAVPFDQRSDRSRSRIVHDIEPARNTRGQESRRGE
jgi:hypothetical protein